jgi:chaperone required for assembly of F1-ATPase
VTKKLDAVQTQCLAYENHRVDKLFYVAEQQHREIDEDIDKWLDIIDGLLLQDDVVLSFARAFKDGKDAQDICDSILETVMKIKNPPDAVKSAYLNVLKEASRSDTGKDKRIFKQERMKFGKELQKFLTARSADFRKLL